MVDRIRALILKDKKVILVTDGKGFYWSPGGHQEVGETHEETLKRELQEELGLGLESMDLIKSIKFPNEEGTRYYYLCRVTGEPKPSSEITDWIWCSFEEFQEKYAKATTKLVPILQILRDQGKL